MEHEIITEKENWYYNGLVVGEVTSGEEASATITGSAPNQSLNLVLPRGPQGEQGIQGKKGETGDTYTITETDYDSIADVVLSKMTNAEEVAY